MEKPETFTLEQIQKELGAPTELQAKANAPTESEAELIERGREIASERILTDVERLYGLAYAFWVGATDDQKELLVGFSEGVLRFAVDRALALRALTTNTDEAGFLDEAEIKRRKTAAATAFAEGIALRDRARKALKRAAPDDTTKQEIDDAVGTAESDDKLRGGLKRLAALGTQLLESKDEVAQARIKEVRLTPEYLQKLLDAATKIETTSKEAAAKPTAKRISQGEIDLLDGVNLSLLRDIVDAFEEANDSDYKIPRLVPISTRRLLGRRPTYKKETAPQC